MCIVCIHSVCHLFLAILNTCLCLLKKNKIEVGEISHSSHSADLICSQETKMESMFLEDVLNFGGGLCSGLWGNQWQEAVDGQMLI